MGYCYNCGNEFLNKELTQEHIPPRCFSDVYSNEFKQNRITVPCCNVCNAEYAKIDSELRDMIAVLKDGNDGNVKFLEKGIKSIIRGKKKGKDYVFDEKVGQYRISLKYEYIEKLFMKCHKGLFYHKFGFPIDRDFESRPVQKMINDKHNNSLNKVFEGFHKSNRPSFVISGHPEIFVGSVIGYNDLGNENFYISDVIGNCFAVSSYFVFHNLIDCLVLGVRKGSVFHQQLSQNKKSSAMPIFKLNIIVSPKEDFDNVKTEIETLLESGNRYIANFYYSKPDDINESDIVLNAEYGSISSMLVDLTEKYTNFKFVKFNPNHVLYYKWMVISQNDSE